MVPILEDLGGEVLGYHDPPGSTLITSDDNLSTLLVDKYSGSSEYMVKLLYDSCIRRLSFIGELSLYYTS